MTKTELMETYTAEQLAEMIVELKEGKENKTMSISDIQKHQEEYEKVLKESPLKGVMNKITRDILEQKNNAMAMEFTRIICDLLKQNGMYVHCTETKLIEKITHKSIEEKYGIVFDSMDFSQHDKEFTDKIEELQSEAEKYRKAFEDVKKERNCQIEEYQKKIEELQQDFDRHKTAMKYSEEYVDSLKKDLDRSKNTINQIDDILEKLFSVRHDDVEKPDEFEDILTDKMCENIEYFIPERPIEVANILIKETGKSCLDKYSVSELRQIAEHLLVYCNHHWKVEE